MINRDKVEEIVREWEEKYCGRSPVNRIRITPNYAHSFYLTVHIATGDFTQR